MSWTRRWGIIGTIALAHVGMALGYQTFLTGNNAEVFAQTPSEPPVATPHPQHSTPPTPAENPLTSEKQPVTTPPIPMPAQAPAVLPDNLKSAAPLPGNVTLPVIAKQPGLRNEGILPVSAQEPGKPTIPPLPDPMQSPTPPLPTGFAPPPNPGGAQQIPHTPPPVKTEPKPLANCPWNLSVEIINGRTHLTAQNGKDVKFTVSCDKLDMETPGGAIHACGKVKLATDSIEGCCDKLTISWQEDIVILDKVQLKCKLEGHDADLNAEQLRVRLSRVTTATIKEQTYSSWVIFP